MSHPHAGPSSGVLRVVGSATASVALTQPPLSPCTRSQVGGLVPASDEGTVARGHSGARAQESASSEVAATRLTAASSWPAAPRQRRARQACRLEKDQAWRPSHGVQDGIRTNIRRPTHPRSTLLGHVCEAHARAEGQADSAVGIAFDAVTKEGREIARRSVDIRAIAAADGAAAEWQPMAVEAADSRPSFRGRKRLAWQRSQWRERSREVGNRKLGVAPLGGFGVPSAVSTLPASWLPAGRASSGFGT